MWVSALDCQVAVGRIVSVLLRGLQMHDEVIRERKQQISADLAFLCNVKIIQRCRTAFALSEFPT